MDLDPARRPRPGSILALGLAVAATLCCLPAAPALAQPSTSVGVTVQGNRLLRDGLPFTPRGFTMIGALTPDWCPDGAGRNARAHLDEDELTAARTAWHADTLRFQVSYSGLTAHRPAARSAYLTRVEAAVALALGEGFVVIVSLQDQAIGCGPARPLPPVGAIDVWRTLAGTFADQPSVLFELWNEPANNASPTRVATDSPRYAYTTSWPDWLSGRTTALRASPDRTAPAFAPFVPAGHQDLLAAVRSSGADNVVIADGSNKSEVLTRMPLLVDPLQPAQVAYATHPYVFDMGPRGWDRRFGDVAATLPVIATEWNVDCLRRSDYRGEERYREALRKQAGLTRRFLAYLTDRQIGLTAWAFDLQGTLVQDWSYTPTRPDDCSYRAGGAAVQAYFRALDGA